MKILTLSCWSNSIHFRLFCRNEFTLLALGSVERVGMGDSQLVMTRPDRQKLHLSADYCDHHGALAMILDALSCEQSGVVTDLKEIAAVGHRVTHGGELFRNSAIIDDKTFSIILGLKPLAPQHIPHNISGIKAARELLPDINHVAVFDTAFHQTIPEHAFVYPLPYEWYQQHSIRRYGFHGHAHLYLSRRAAALLDKRPEECNLVTIYLDRGVSVCAIRNGVSIDTSMGLTPLEGAVMDTRCGDIDAGIITFEMNRGNLSSREIDSVLNHKSGLQGITGMRYDRGQLVQQALSGDRRCELALEIEAYRLKKYIGSYCAAVGPLDGIVFSYGSGDSNWYLRQMVLEGMDSFGVRLDHDKNRSVTSCDREFDITLPDSRVGIFVIPSNEQLVFAEDVASILNNGSVDHISHAYAFSRTDFVPHFCSDESDPH